MHYLDPCYNVRNPRSRCRFRDQYEKQQETASEEDKGEAVSGKPDANSWEGDCPGDGLDIESDHCTAVGSGVERANEVPDSRLPFAKLAARSAYAAERKRGKANANSFAFRH